MGTLSTGEFVVAWGLAALVSAAVFLHADRRGSRHATAWGIFVFLFLGVGLPAYAIHAWSLRRRRPR